MNNVTRPTKIHIWIPDYESAMGGIQVFSRFFIRALGECLPEAEFSVLSKNDNSFPVLPLPAGRNRFTCAGWWPRAIRTPAFACRLLAHTLRHRPDLVLTTHVNFSPVASWAKRLAGVPYVAVAHGVDVWGARTGWLRKALRHADFVLAVSQFTRQRIIEGLKLPAHQVGLLPNTVDAEKFTPAPKPRYLLKRFGLKPEQPVILTIARLASEERYKGYDQILRALPAIRRELPDVRYIVGGRGPDHARIKALANELGLAKNVTFAGYVPDHELCDFYNLCDVFAMPSKQEGFGIVFLEALACGKPVLAGNQDGSVDALLGGEVGVLVDPDNVRTIGDSLSAILLKRHPLTVLQQPGQLRARAIETYGFGQFRNQLAAHLSRLGVSVHPLVCAALPAS